MYSFFILGQVPGTAVTITFTMWLQLCALIIGLLALYRVQLNRTITYYMPPTISYEVGSALRPLTV